MIKQQWQLRNISKIQHVSQPKYFFTCEILNGNRRGTTEQSVFPHCNTDWLWHLCHKAFRSTCSPCLLQATSGQNNLPFPQPDVVSWLIKHCHSVAHPFYQESLLNVHTLSNTSQRDAGNAFTLSYGCLQKIGQIWPFVQTVCPLPCVGGLPSDAQRSESDHRSLNHIFPR